MVQKHIIHDAQTGKTTVVDYTAEEQAAYDDYNSTAKVTARKLEKVKQIRLEKLKATDWMSASDVTMPDYIKTWRQTLRDLPANHTNETAYNLLLARDSDGKLTHSVWTQPTS
jgi:geranylgeranyl pyrophosphate synthase